MPVISVVIPAYNAESTIVESLESVLAQTFEDFDVVVVDDGSTDQTGAVALALGDPRVRVLRTANSGVANARNHGIAETSGELVAFLDADDLWEPEKLEQQVSAFRRAPDAGLCVTGAVRIDAKGHFIEEIEVRQSADICRTLLLNAMAVGMLSSGMVRREALEHVGGFDPRFSQCADWDLWLRISAALPVCVVDAPLLRYRTYPGNMSSNIALLERDTFGVLDAFYSSEHSHRYGSLKSRVYGRYWMMCAGSYLHAGRAADAFRCGLRGVLTHPTSVVRVLGLPSRRARRAILRRASGE